jgi:endonuclease I
MQKSILLLLVLILSTIIVSGQIPSGYYDNAEGLVGNDLKSALHNIIDDHSAQSYDNLWNILVDSDEDPNNSNNFILIYTGRSLSKTSTYPDWNREHVWAKSHGDFDNTPPAGTDAHHIRPSDVSVNSDRGNLDFDNGGSQHSEATGCYYDNDSWEPRDAVKGDVARMMFYMVVRYEGDVSGEPDLELVDYVPTSGPIFGKFSTLLDWHEQDPVDDFERNKNEVVYSHQNNRNPFIDHPEYVDYIWGDPNQNTPPVISDISISPATPTESDAVNIQASITDATGSIASAELNWGLTSGQLNNTITMSDNGSYYITNSNIPAQSTDTKVFYEISATDDSSATTISDQKSYTVGESSVTLLNEDFAACPPADWTDYSLSSIEDWHCSGSEDIEINAYDGDAACNDWLITPSLNLDEYQEEKLTFKTWTRYSDTYYPPLEVKYSANYTEGTDPGTATWNTLSCTLSAEDSQAWTSSGEIDLSQISGNNIHIAFHYTSSGSGGGTSSWWKVDDVVISATNTINNYPVISDVSVTPNNPTELDTVLISATITDDDLISAAYVEWYTKENPTVQTNNMNSAGDNYFTEIPPQAANDSLYFTIKAEDSNAQITSYTHEGIYINDEPSVGIKNDQKERFSIYPNPAKNYFRIKTDYEYTNNLKINIYTITGQKIYTKEIAPENTVHLEDVPRGTYIIRIKGKKHTTNKRLILK